MTRRSYLVAARRRNAARILRAALSAWSSSVRRQAEAVAVRSSTVANIAAQVATDRGARAVAHAHLSRLRAATRSWLALVHRRQRVEAVIVNKKRGVLRASLLQWSRLATVSSLAVIYWAGAPFFFNVCLYLASREWLSYFSAPAHRPPCPQARMRALAFAHCAWRHERRLVSAALSALTAHVRACRRSQETARRAEALRASRVRRLGLSAFLVRTFR